jgi:methyl-accepting chemotaxis protein
LKQKMSIDTVETINRVNNVAEMVRQVSFEVETIARESQQMSQSATLGEKVTRDVALEIGKIHDMTKGVARVVEELAQSTGEISSIIALIRNIAAQTTLLAINAAIEAARAGEHGKDFGVVATETGKLADQTKQAAQLIENLLNKMDRRSQRAVKFMVNRMKVVESGKALTADSTVIFTNIFQQWARILKRIEWVAVSARKMAESNEDMIENIDNSFR